MSKFEQFFASKKVMLTSFIITLIAYAFMIVAISFGIVSNLPYIYYLAFAVIMFFIAFAMYRSFSKHETNAMNIVTGAAIGILLIYDVQYAVSCLNLDLFDTITVVIEAVLMAILLINHVQINSIHRSTRGRIILNQVVLIAIAVYQIIYIITSIGFYSYWFDLAYVIAGVVAIIFMCFMIICIETKLNAYKIDRGVAQAKGTWTDDKKVETKEKYFGK